MSSHFVTGKLGGGKTLVSVGRIRDYILAGKKVATNLDLNLEHLIPRDNKDCVVYRVPDKPTIEDLNAIGRATNSKMEEDFGLLVLDELGTWLNSRTYQKDKQRQEVIDWFLHARKLGWDVFLIVQDVDLIDKQVRISLGEHIVICRRTDRIPLPFIGFFFKLFTGVRITLPRVHVGTVFYGSGLGAIKVDNWIYRGNDLFNAYDTSQIFETNENRIAQFIPPHSLDLRKFATKNKEFYMRLTKIYFKRLKTPLAFGLGLVLNFVFLIAFLGFSGNYSEAIPQGEDIPQGASVATKGKSRIITDDLKNINGMRLVPVSFTRRFISDRVTVRYLYEGVFYNEKSFPMDITWVNSKPFYYAKVESEEVQESETEL